jgi:predicted HTH transcriptional regulator
MSHLRNWVTRIIEKNKIGHVIALRQTQSTIRMESPNWQPWLSFFLSSLCSKVKRLSEKVESAKLFTQHLPKLSADLMALAREQGRITTQIAEQQTAANRAMIRAHLIKLVKDSHLVKYGAGRGTWYVASKS